VNKILVTGKSIEEARKNAAAQLGADVDEIMYEVLENATSGFFGIITKPCKIAAWIEGDEEEIVEAPKPVETKKEEKPKKKERAIAQDKTEGEKLAKEFLSTTLSQMGIEAELEFTQTEDALEIVVSGENMGRVIGKRGETLDALQYLTSLVVNKDKEEYIRINLDSENYRAKRTLALEKLADKVADKVIRNKRNLTLEPMNAFERRVIHSRLQGNEKLTTYSIGEEPSRRIVVSLAKDR
jgi:spoIIIJ-associated protein